MMRSKILPALALGAALMMTLPGHAGRGDSARYLTPTGRTLVGSINAGGIKLGIGGFAFDVQEGETTATISLTDATGGTVGGTYYTDTNAGTPFCGSADADVTDAKTLTVTVQPDSATTCGAPATTGTINVDFS